MEQTLRVRFADSEFHSHPTCDRTVVPLLIAQRRRGRSFRLDADSLARLYREVAPQMTGFFTSRLKDPGRAVDLTAETFAQAFADRRKFRGRTREEAVGWLYGIGRNKLLRHYRDGDIELRALRRIGVERRELTVDDIERILDLAAVQGVKRHVNDALRALPASQRQAVELRVVEELEYGEIAAQLGISEQNARARVSRGLRDMAGRLDGLDLERV
jgi:RNA polymerase sigma-70 factor (ECF subfamily)